MLSYTQLVCWTSFCVDTGLTGQLTAVSHFSPPPKKRTCGEKSATTCLALFCNWINPFHSSTHLFTYVLGSWVWRCFLFARRCCRSKIFKGGRHICAFVEIVLGWNLQGNSQKRWGRGYKKFEIAWFQYCVIHYRDMCSMTFKNPYNSLICLVDFPAVSLTFPPPKTEAFESLDWLVAKRRSGIRFFGLGILGCRVGQDETSKMSILDILVASCLGCTIPNSDLFIVLFSNIFPENIGISQEFYGIINAYPLTWRLGYGSTILYPQLRHNLLTFLRTNRCVAKALQKRISDAVKAWGDVASERSRCHYEVRMLQSPVFLCI